MTTPRRYVLPKLGQLAPRPPGLAVAREQRRLEFERIMACVPGKKRKMHTS